MKPSSNKYHSTFLGERWELYPGVGFIPGCFWGMWQNFPGNILNCMTFVLSLNSNGTRLLLYLSIYSMYVFLSNYWKICVITYCDTSANVYSIIWSSEISCIYCFRRVQRITYFQQSIPCNSFKVVCACAVEPSNDLCIFWFKLKRNRSHTLHKFFP